MIWGIKKVRLCQEIVYNKTKKKKEKDDKGRTSTQMLTKVRQRFISMILRLEELYNVNCKRSVVDKKLEKPKKKKKGGRTYEKYT